MSIHRLREDIIGEAIYFCRSELTRLGYEVTTTQDFDKVKEITAQMGKKYFTPSLDPLFNDFTAANCFWQILSKDGEPHICGGVRLDDLGTTRVGEYWRNWFKRLYGEGEKEHILGVSPVLDDALRGRLVYFGDLHVDERHRGNLDALALYLCHGQALVCLKWNPDFTYAFIHDRFVAQGAAFRYGFNRTERMAQRWIQSPPTPRSSHECCAFSSRDQLMEYFADPSRLLSRVRRDGQ